MTAIRLWLVEWLYRIAAWIDIPSPEAPPPDGLFQRAVVLVRDADKLDGSGEAKRHQVYARLIKEFPARSKRDISLSIEAGLT